MRRDHKNLILEGHFEKIQGVMESGVDTASYTFNKDITASSRLEPSARRTASASRPTRSNSR